MALDIFLLRHASLRHAAGNIPLPEGEPCIYDTNNCCYCLVAYDIKKEKLETPNIHGGYATMVQDRRVIVKPAPSMFSSIFSWLHSLAVQRFGSGF